MSPVATAPDGYVLVGYEAQSLWQGGGWYAGVVCIPSGTKPVIASPGNRYDGPRTWDIERRGDVGEIRFGLRSKSIERMVSWLAKREASPLSWLEADVTEAIGKRRR